MDKRWKCKKVNETIRSIHWEESQKHIMRAIHTAAMKKTLLNITNFLESGIFAHVCPRTQETEAEGSLQIQGQFQVSQQHSKNSQNQEAGKRVQHVLPDELSSDPSTHSGGSQPPGEPTPSSASGTELRRPNSFIDKHMHISTIF